MCNVGVVLVVKISAVVVVLTLNLSIDLPYIQCLLFRTSPGDHQIPAVTG